MADPLFDEALPQSLYGIMPGNRVGQLRKKTAHGNPDTFRAEFDVDARKVTVTRAVRSLPMLQMSTPTAAFDIWTDGTRDYWSPPANEDTYVDEDGTLYTILDVEETILGTLYNCVCGKKWAQT